MDFVSSAGSLAKTLLAQSDVVAAPRIGDSCHVGGAFPTTIVSRNSTASELIELAVSRCHAYIRYCDLHQPLRTEYFFGAMQDFLPRLAGLNRLQRTPEDFACRKGERDDLMPR